MREKCRTQQHHSSCKRERRARRVGKLTRAAAERGSSPAAAPGDEDIREGNLAWCHSVWHSLQMCVLGPVLLAASEKATQPHCTT